MLSSVSLARRALLGLIGTALAATALSADAVTHPRLYALDCGRIDFKDLSVFSDTGEYDGQSGSIVVPCFVVRHPKGTLVWDTGLGDALKDHPPPTNSGGVTLHVDVTLAQQLRTLGIAPQDVTYVAFSHLHGDHTGNANLFASATWIMNRTELAWALGKPTPFVVDPATFSAYKSAKMRLIDGDDDVFGDGTVRILKTPGHTPGHQVLVLRLAKAGTVILAGDLYHMRRDRAEHLVTIFNTDRAATLASFDRIDRIVRNTHARVIVQHDPQDFKSLPAFPAYLE
jgi:glyoxylase-like metal-dependent hydrolase (beta-lactamase superfamily II)